MALMLECNITCHVLFGVLSATLYFVVGTTRHPVSILPMLHNMNSERGQGVAVYLKWAVNPHTHHL